MQQKILLGLLLLVSLTACHIKQPMLLQTESHATQSAKPDTTLIPAFSGEVLYLFGREYVAIYDSLSSKFNHPNSARIRESQLTMDQYVENRLREWYPEVAYSGMVRKWYLLALQIADVPAAEIRLFVNREFRKQHAQGNFHHSFTDAEESAFLQLTVEEQAYFNYLNQLATSHDFAQPESLLHASYATEREQSRAFTPDIHESFDRENVLTSLMLAGGPYALYRVLLSKQRAEKQAKAYYGADTNAGKQGDAFKHMYVNVLLRAYTSKEIAKFVMDDVWERWHVNAVCDRYMDLHNNQIGRTLRYWDFHQNTDDWTEWAENVHLFVQDSTHSAFKLWDRETMQFKILHDLRQTPDEQYIYWNTEKADSTHIAP